MSEQTTEVQPQPKKVMPKAIGRPAKTDSSVLKSRFYSFLITGNTNQQMFQRYDIGTVEMMVAKLNSVIKETFGDINSIKEIMRFVGTDDEIKNLNFDEIVKQISVDSSVEIGAVKGALHFHCVVAIHTYHNINFNLTVLSEKLKTLWGAPLYLNVQKNVDSQRAFQNYVNKQSRDI